MLKLGVVRVSDCGPAFDHRVPPASLRVGFVVAERVVQRRAVAQAGSAIRCAPMNACRQY